MRRFRLQRTAAWSVLALVWMATIVSPALAQGSKRRAVSLIKQAIELDSNQVAKKIELYTDAIKEDASNYLPFTNRAVCYINYGLWDQAIRDANRAIELASENPHPWGVRGRAYAGRREFEKAFSDLNRALKLVSDDEQKRNLLNDRGNAHFSKRDYAAAVKDYKEVVELDKEFAKGWNNLGIAYRAMGKLSEAIEAFQVARSLDEKSARLLVNRGQLYVARNDQVLAEKDFDEAVRLDGADPGALLQRGMFRYLANRPQEALADFMEVHRQYVDNTYAAVWIYLAQAKLGKKGDGVTQLQAYADKQKDKSWPMPIVTMLLEKTTPEQLVSAAKATDDAVHQRERLAEAYYYISQRYAIAGDGKQRDENLVKATEQNSPRVQEQVMAQIALAGWQAPAPTPPRAVPADSSSANPTTTVRTKNENDAPKRKPPKLLDDQQAEPKPATKPATKTEE